MTRCVKILKKCRDAYEVILPCICLVILFLAFLIQIFMRYVVKSPIRWSMEIQAWMFIWAVYSGANYIFRKRQHVEFTIIYDQLGVRGKGFMQLFADSVIAVTFSILLPYAIEYVFGKVQTTATLHVSLIVVFFPVILFVLSGIIYSVVFIVRDVKALNKIKNGQLGGTEQ